MKDQLKTGLLALFIWIGIIFGIKINNHLILSGLVLVPIFALLMEVCRKALLFETQKNEILKTIEKLRYEGTEI